VDLRLVLTVLEAYAQLEKVTARSDSKGDRPNPTLVTVVPQDIASHDDAWSCR
jgi:hypothetical protein